MIPHLLVGTLLLAMLATTLSGHLGHEAVIQPAVAAAQQNDRVPGPGFVGAFGHGPAVRNLVF